MWLCGGDFNLIMRSNEKSGARDFDMNQASILRRAVEKCIRDTRYVGHDFT